MNLALLFGTGATLTWLTSRTKNEQSDIENEQSDIETVYENDAQSLKQMVQQVLNGQVDAPRKISSDPIPSAVKGETLADEEEIEGEEYINPKISFKSITTDLVNKTFLAKKGDVFRFLRLVIDTHVKALKHYKLAKGLEPTQIQFVYKGGNVLRIVANEFLVELPGHASDIIDKYYMPYFRRSDADFSIYIDPKLKHFQKIHSDLTQLTYLLQQHIRERIMANPHKYFEFYRLNEETQLEILNVYLKTLNESEGLTNPTNERFYGGFFKGVKFEGLKVGEQTPDGTSQAPDMIITSTKGKKTLTYIPDDTVLHSLRIQYNTSLEFGEGKEIAAFHLVRTKIMFLTLFITETGKQQEISFGGELIDVGLPKQKDSALSHFFNTPGAIDRYELKHNGESLRFLGYTLQFLIDDLDLILFRRSDMKPWKDTKYIKRINRLFYLCFVQLFMVFESNALRKRYMKDFCERVATKALKSNLKSRVNKLTKKYKKQPVGFNNLAERIAESAIPITDAEFIDYREFVDLLQQNCITVLTAFKNIGQFCSKGSTLSEKRIYQGTFNSLIPGE